MLTPRKLDNQSYEEIVSEALARLPWLCPVWTDHNSHDPGITILELMAWYKELQQYYMDQITPDIRRKLLELAGMELREEQAAVCTLELPEQAGAYLPLTRLAGPGGLCFELLEAVPVHRPRLERVLAEQGGERTDITELCAGGTPFAPFLFGGEDSALLLGLSRPAGETLRLWFRVERPEGVVRNRPDEVTPPPRTLNWELVGAGETAPLEDETWSLSWSGAVTLSVPECWQPGEDGLYWIRLRQTDPGCEERVRLSGMWADRFRAAQQESRARTYEFTIADGPDQQVLAASAQAAAGQLAVFLRTPSGWRQTDAYQALRGPEGLRLTVDGTGAARDGADNLLVAALDPIHTQGLFFDGTGLPGQQLFLDLGGQQVLTRHLRLLCLTREEDGSVRPEVWRLTQDLSACGPRDRVFAYDPQRELLEFGDGEHGAVPASGFGAILVTELILSRCGGGNVPADAGLTLPDGIRAENDPAWGGWDRESLAQCRGRLLKKLSTTSKCLSAEDYERRVRQTPGLRVAGVKALPGADPRWGQRRSSASVTVVVLPASEESHPRADRRFLEAVSRQMERYRPICVRTRVVPARYVPFALSVQLLAGAGAREEDVRQALERRFAPREENIGAYVRLDDVMAALQKCPGVLQVRRAQVRGLDQNSYETASGDLQIPPDAIADLVRTEIQLLRA